MAVESEEFTELSDEFALVSQTAAEAGLSGSSHEAPRVRRGWVNVPAGGHVSGVFWGDGLPELVLLHDRGETHRYIAASRTVAERVLGLYAVARDLPADTFPVSPLPYVTLTVNDYPTWTYDDTGRDEDKLLLLEHADGSAVTVLAQQGDYEGLQIQLPDGDWLPVPDRSRCPSGLLRDTAHPVEQRAAPPRQAPCGGGRHRDQAVDRRLLLPGP